MSVTDHLGPLLLGNKAFNDYSETLFYPSSLNLPIRSPYHAQKAKLRAEIKFALSVGTYLIFSLHSILFLVIKKVAFKKICSISGELISMFQKSKLSAAVSSGFLVV